MKFISNNYPRISIITPSFNQGNYIEETILSIICQDYPNLEYIIIDGGSSDNTIDIIKKYEKSISYWVSEPDAGQTQAINKGFRLATGDICTWINSDDLIFEGALWKVAKYFSEDKELEFIHGKGIYFDDKGHQWPADKNLDNLKIRYISHFCYDLQPSTYYRKAIFEKIGYLDESYILQMDAEFFMRIGLNCKIMKVDDLLSKFREHDLRKSNVLKDDILVEKEFFKRYSKLLRSFPFTDDLIQDADAFNIYVQGDDKYPVSNNYNRAQLEQSFYIFLVIVLQGQYMKANYKDVKQLTAYLSRHYNHIFNKDRTISKILRRLPFLQLIPPQLIRWIRQMRTSQTSSWLPNFLN